MTDRVEAQDEMRQRLPEAIDQLAVWRTAEGEYADHRATLVHCQSGISRSATVVIAFMMKIHGMKLMDAYRHVFERCVTVRGKHSIH